MKHFFTISFLLFLTACAGYRAPSMSGDPAGMSADTLCYRHAGARSSPALRDEIRARGLDCASILEDDPLYTGHHR